jgi:hypothetical protein
VAKAAEGRRRLDRFVMALSVKVDLAAASFVGRRLHNRLYFSVISAGLSMAAEKKTEKNVVLDPGQGFERRPYGILPPQCETLNRKEEDDGHVLLPV